MNENAIKFKLNVDYEIQKLQAQFKDVEASKSKILGRSQEAGVKAGARYECIYKNFLRDIRQFFSQKFDSFTIRIQYVYKLTPRQRYEAFPFQMLHFTLENFDENLIEMTRQYTKFERIEYIKQIAFTLGSFILPKQMMKSFLDPPEVFSKEILTPEENIKLQKYIDSVISKLERSAQSGTPPTYNFFGILAGTDIEAQKLQVLDTYKLIFRFSIQKLIKYLGDFPFL